MHMKMVRVEEKVWYELMSIKLEQKKKNLSDVVKDLLDRYNNVKVTSVAELMRDHGQGD